MLTKTEKSNPVSNSNRRLGVLISGRGSNLQALIDAIAAGTLHASIAVVISNIEDAYGLQRARAAGIEAVAISHRGWPSRDDYERALVDELRRRDVELVCLAGFMRILAGPLIDAFPGAILNIHPALLPSFPGTDAQRQAFEHGAKITGVTVHFVTRELDAGPIVLQRAVAVEDGDTVESLAARILEAEHQAYPEAVELVLNRAWRLDGRRVVRSPSGGGASPTPLPAGS
jgi:phosphoribosylglycinamide formyltransferase-1